VAITNYTELQAAVANWLGRGDLTSRIIEAIALAEAKMNRKLRTLDMVTKNATFSITGEYVAVPTNFGGAKTFYLNTNPVRHLEPLSDEYLNTAFNSSGAPLGYVVQGTNFRFGPVPSQTYSSTLVYWLKVPALTGGNPTNWLLTSHPDAYLALCCSAMCGLAREWDAAAGYRDEGYSILQEIVDQSKKDRIGDGSLMTRPM